MTIALLPETIEALAREEALARKLQDEAVQYAEDKAKFESQYASQFDEAAVTVFVSREEKTGEINGLHKRRQEGYAEEEMLADDARVLEYEKKIVDPLIPKTDTVRAVPLGE